MIPITLPPASWAARADRAHNADRCAAIDEGEAVGRDCLAEGDGAGFKGGIVPNA